MRLFWTDNNQHPVPAQYGIIFQCLDGTYGLVFDYVGNNTPMTMFWETEDRLIKFLTVNNLVEVTS